jgi:hypothetical protein
MKEPNMWSRATRKKGNGGLHLYVPKEMLERALSDALIDPAENDLLIRVHTFKTNWKGRGRIMVELKVERRKEANVETVCQPIDGGTGKIDEQGSGCGALWEDREPLSQREDTAGHGPSEVLAQIPAPPGLQDHSGDTGALR